MKDKVFEEEWKDNKEIIWGTWLDIWLFNRVSHLNDDIPRL